MKYQYNPEAVVETNYRNWKGEISKRRFVPINLFWEKNKYHQEPQWLLVVWDIDKKDYRTYAMKDLESFGGPNALQ